jgi:hypothetical protein
MPFIIVVNMPLSNTAFTEVQNLFIASVAATAGVMWENVQIISIKELYARTFNIASRQPLSAMSIGSSTNVCTHVGHSANLIFRLIRSQPLNSNLIQREIPISQRIQTNLKSSKSTGIFQVNVTAGIVWQHAILYQRD